MSRFYFHDRKTLVEAVSNASLALLLMISVLIMGFLAVFHPPYLLVYAKALGGFIIPMHLLHTQMEKEEWPLRKSLCWIWIFGIMWTILAIVPTPT